VVFHPAIYHSSSSSASWLSLEARVLRSVRSGPVICLISDHAIIQPTSSRPGKSVPINMLDAWILEFLIEVATINQNKRDGRMDGRMEEGMVEERLEEKLEASKKVEISTATGARRL